VRTDEPQRHESMMGTDAKAPILGYARVLHLAEEGCPMPMATRTKRWTLEELDRLPEDGNRYELVRGELFVTPAPTDDHETIAARLTRLVDPYVAAHGLGYVYRPRAVVQRKGSQVEPDLMVRAAQTTPRATWKRAPLPILIRRDSLAVHTTA
jgi:Putative restriction endonuclease